MTDAIVFEFEVSLSETILERISIIRHASVPFFCDRSSGIEYEALEKYNPGKQAEFLARKRFEVE